MINLEFEAQGTKYQCCQIFGSVAGNYRGLKLRIFAHACAVSALSLTVGLVAIRYMLQTHFR